MSASPKFHSNINHGDNPLPGKPMKKELSSELQDHPDEVQQDMKTLISPLKERINLLLKIKNSWESGLKECNALRSINTELNARINKVENDKKLLNIRVHQLEDKLLEGNVVFQEYLTPYWNPLSQQRRRYWLRFFTP